MSSQATFKAVKKSLIDPANVDRAGAASSATIHDLAERLKQIHKFHFVGSQIAWEMWATQLIGLDCYQRDLRVNDPPPGKLIELFRRAQDPSDVVLGGVRQNATIGRRVNEVVLREVAQVREAFDGLSMILQEFQVQMNLLGSRLTLMETARQASTEILSTVVEAVEKNEAAENFYINVENLEDPDHIF